MLFGTGFGPTVPTVPSNLVFVGAAPITTEPVIKIGGIPANVLLAGLTSNDLYRFNIEIPGLPTGDHEVVTTVDSASTTPRVYLAIQN